MNEKNGGRLDLFATNGSSPPKGDGNHRVRRHGGCSYRSATLTLSRVAGSFGLGVVLGSIGHTFGVPRLLTDSVAVVLGGVLGGLPNCCTRGGVRVA